MTIFGEFLLSICCWEFLFGNYEGFLGNYVVLYVSIHMLLIDDIDDFCCVCVFLVLKPPWVQRIIFWHGVASAASLLHFILCLLQILISQFASSLHLTSIFPALN